ncbi:hypothetical protein PCH_Pc16g01290 [Penicillium rubens Wisconsin 54-1255]|uniref:Uncharacterized protein n=1 Tax=Penicillium rubens (strain ATCC 28089 / DSM 1075 / NRRL 1951 / Wisconsin 54-1255) TaxID=500485 RepID=B6H726_PENRW|nr:hypothetical protein PCH_Pc16g01290 [Penicillium rubens Wisconsin 54-1255]
MRSSLVKYVIGILGILVDFRIVAVSIINLGDRRLDFIVSYDYKSGVRAIYPDSLYSRTIIKKLREVKDILGILVDFRAVAASIIIFSNYKSGVRVGFVLGRLS